MHMRPQIQQFGDELHLTAPYIPGLASGSRRLGGVAFPDNVWVFRSDQLLHVRDMCRTFYGHDGTVEAHELVDLRVYLGQIELNPWYAEGRTEDNATTTNAIRIGGRDVAVRHAADKPVELGPGVYLVAGAFDETAGEPDAPMIGTLDGIVLVISDLLLSRFDALPSYHGMELDRTTLPLLMVIEHATRSHDRARLLDHWVAQQPAVLTRVAQQAINRPTWKQPRLVPTVGMATLPADPQS